MKRTIHFLVHLITAFWGLVILAALVDYLSVWEVILFLLLTFLPYADQIFYAAIRYTDNPIARMVTNLILTGDTAEYVFSLHEKRGYFSERVIHNLLVYLGLWSLWYAAYIFDFRIILVSLSAIITHLMTDLANDYYEFGRLSAWGWPFYLAGQSFRSLFKIP